MCDKKNIFFFLIKLFFTHFIFLLYVFVFCYRYNNLNIDQILSSDRLVTNYVECLLSRKPCPPEGKDLKRKWNSHWITNPLLFSHRHLHLQNKRQKKNISRFKELNTKHSLTDLPKLILIKCSNEKWINHFFLSDKHFFFIEYS